ncbi:MAG TPA: putative Fe-S cluster assembly protein SufT [Nevskiaceae bacterium]
MSGEEVTLSRDCIGTLVPQGTRVELPAGVQATITQALGGSYTILVEGHMFRIAAEDADVLGKESIITGGLDKDATDEEVEKKVYEQLMTCFDPEIPINIVDLGLVYECDIKKNDEGNWQVKMQMTLTAPGCGMGEVLIADIKEKLATLGVTDVDVELVFDPPWRMDMMTEEARLQAGLM